MSNWTHVDEPSLSPCESVKRENLKRLSPPFAFLHSRIPKGAALRIASLGIGARNRCQNPVLTPEAEGDWEVTSFLSLAVMHDGTGFRMWYGGADPRGFAQVGVAASPDGSTWARYSGKPVFRTGPAGSFDHGVVIPAAVFRHGGLYHMWYNAVGVPTVFATGTIGYATVRGRVELDPAAIAGTRAGAVGLGQLRRLWTPG